MEHVQSSAHLANRRSRQRGFSMVEVLIAVVVLAVGMLAMAMMQVMSKRSNLDSAQRTAATQLASDILERMRANTSQLSNYAGSAQTPSAAVGDGTLTSPGVDCSTATCTAFQQYQYDMWKWEQSLLGSSAIDANGNRTDALVLPTACIMTDVNSALTNRSGQYWVAIAWRGGTPLTNPTNPASPAPTPDPYACGSTTSKYHTSTSQLDNAYRRVLVVNTYIIQ